jgi:hypothetical protein
MKRGDPLARLAGLLEEERGQLLAGNSAALFDLARRKAEALAALEALPREAADAAALSALGESARRNEALIGAALRGVAAARTRLAEARETASRLQTYDRSGQRSKLDGSAVSLERKA